MKYVSCLHPKRIYNKYINDFMYVGCGKCEACLNRRTVEWIARLKQERKCWKYCLFITLTYDDKNLPLLSPVAHGVYCDLGHKHTSPGVDSPLLDLTEFYKNPVEYEKEISFLKQQRSIPYLSKYDCQCFVKRCRKNLRLYLNNNFNFKKSELNEKDYKIRYFLCGEYGSTTFRPHYHCLFFFDSEKVASCIQEIVYKSWKFGLVDSSFVSEDNSSYVAGYLNCLAHLPKFYSQFIQIRPFSLCSKCPPIGTLETKNSELREMFLSASPTRLVANVKKQTYDDVPLWKTYQYKLFPRLSYFDKIADYDRIRLYSLCQHYEKYAFIYSAKEACSLIKENYFLAKANKPNMLRQCDIKYIDMCRNFSLDESTLDNFLLRWFYISSRVVFQSLIWDIPVSVYISKIVEYYQNVEKLKLNNQFRLEQQLLEDASPSVLLGLYPDFMYNMLELFSIEDATFEEIELLKSVGIDVDRFFSDDLSVSIAYRDTLVLENQKPYKVAYGDAVSTYRKHIKTKVKNDYLSSHPELSNYKIFHD